MVRKPIPFPARSKDAEIFALKQEIAAKMDRLAKLSTETDVTWFWQNLTTRLRNQGMLLPGDGKGGLIPRKE